MLHTTHCTTAALPLSPHTKATLEKHGIVQGGKLLPQINLSPTKVVQRRDAGCITDLCTSDQIDEVEIFSLLEEQLPRYKLRADSLTKFGGYQNNDWYLEVPAFPIPEGGFKISKELAQETLNYFLLSGDRASQMTRTFDDPEAISRLLEEKEKDLELTVQIGKELLQQNSQLESRISDLESELKAATENISQLTHDLQQKNELINVLTNDLDDGSESGTPLGAKSINFDLLQRKVSSLENENKALRSEAAQIAKETTEVEEQERKLMEDIAYQLSTANSESHAISLELERYKEENRLQQEQIINLTARLHSTELRLHDLLTENEETSSLLQITKENQNALALELAEFKAKYQEVLTLLRDAQDQIRKQKKKTVPVARSSLFSVSCGRDSLQSELMETSLMSDNSLDSGIMSDSAANQKPPSEYRKVFETVRHANDHLIPDNLSHISAMSIMTSSSQPRMASTVSSSASQRYRPYGTTDAMSTISGSTTSYNPNKIMDETSTPDDLFPTAAAGVPGAPGAKDLESALKRLTQAEIMARRATLSSNSMYSYDDGDNAGFRTPDSIMSLGSCRTGVSSLSSGSQWKIPEKLQIVKPMEGSQTLFHWQKLATPTLGGIFEERTGVAVRGGRTLDDLGMQIYSLEDVEEDEELVPQKRFQQSSTVFTYTDSKILHPDDGTAPVTFSLPPSQMSSRIGSAMSSRQPSVPATPRASLSRRNSCSTFSMHTGLASVLNERGIKAIRPSAFNTPMGANYSPTVTPCNSPDGSPPRSPAPDQLGLTGLLASGADMLRRKLYGPPVPVERPSRAITRNKIALSRLERKQLKSIKILEKVESIGVDNIMNPPTTVSPLALHSTSMYRRSDSPMAQLTSFKHLSGESSAAATAAEGNNTSEKSTDEVVIDKDMIRAVLSKGLASTDRSVVSDSQSDAMSVGSDDESSRKENKGPTETSAVLANSCARRMQRQKSRRHINGGGARRADLGTVSRTNTRELGTVPDKKIPDAEGSFTQGFVGTISSLIFGRKGGFT